MKHYLNLIAIFAWTLLLITSCNTDPTLVDIETTTANHALPEAAYGDPEPAEFTAMRTHLEDMAYIVSEMSGDNEFKSLVEDLVAEEFDGDFNVLLKTLSEQMSLSSSLSAKYPTQIALFAELLYYDEGTYFPQIFIPDFNDINLVPIPKVISYLEETEPYDGYELSGTNPIDITINESEIGDPDVENNVWVLSINERMNDNGELMGTPGNEYHKYGSRLGDKKGRTNVPVNKSGECFQANDPVCLTLESFTIYEPKEKKVQGDAEIYYSYVFYNPGDNIDTRGAAGNKLFLQNIDVKDMDHCECPNRNGARALKSNINKTIKCDWDRNEHQMVAVLIYEYSVVAGWRNNRGTVPPRAGILDFREDEISAQPYYQIGYNFQNGDDDPINPPGQQLELRFAMESVTKVTDCNPFFAVPYGTFAIDACVNSIIDRTDYKNFTTNIAYNPSLEWMDDCDIGGTWQQEWLYVVNNIGATDDYINVANNIQVKFKIQ